MDATKPAWRFDAIEIRSLDSDLGFRGSACDEIEVNWESGAIAYSNDSEVRCTKFTSTKIRGFLSNANLRRYNPEDLEYKRNTSIFPHLIVAKHVSSYKRNGLTWTATWTEDQCMPCWCGLLSRTRSGYGTLRNTDCSVVNCTRNTNTKL